MTDKDSNEKLNGCFSVAMCMAFMIYAFFKSQWLFWGLLALILLYRYTTRDRRRIEAEQRAERERLDTKARLEQERRDQRAREEQIELNERLRAEHKALAEAREAERVAHRDADSQTEPYEYRCVGHPNATLAIRYGIANMRRVVEPRGYYGRAEGRSRHPNLGKGKLVDAESIRLRKLRKVDTDKFLCELPDFGKRKVVAIIEKGTESVKTFYPRDNEWFERHADLELTLKDNKTFTLKELANFHVIKTVKGR